MGRRLDERLIGAIWSRDLDQIVELLNQGVRINNKDEDGHGYLYSTAIAKGPQAGEVAELLIKHGADVNTNTNSGRSPLHVAIFSGNFAVTEVLLTHGADINAVDGELCTPLHYAVRNNQKEVAKVLVARGANRHAKNQNGESPIQLAEQRGFNEIVQILTGRDSQVSGTDKPKSFVATETERKTVNVVTPEQLADDIMMIVKQHQSDDSQLTAALIHYFGTRERSTEPALTRVSGSAALP